MRSAASMVADSNGSTTRVSADSLRRTPSASAWLRAALPALATPCLECVAHWRSDDPVTSMTPATISATTSTSTPTRPMNGLSTAHCASPSSPPCALMYASRKQGVRTLAGEDAEGVRGGRERDAGDDEGDAPGHAAARPALLLDDEQVRDEAEQEREREGEDPDEPAGGVAAASGRATRRPSPDRGRSRGRPRRRGRRSRRARGGAARPEPASSWGSPRRAVVCVTLRPRADVPVSGVQSP